MKQLKITIGDAGGCTAGSFKRTGRASCVQKAGKAKVGDTALVTCKFKNTHESVYFDTPSLNRFKDWLFDTVAPETGGTL